MIKRRKLGYLSAVVGVLAYCIPLLAEEAVDKDEVIIINTTPITIPFLIGQYTPVTLKAGGSRKHRCVGQLYVTIRTAGQSQPNTKSLQCGYKYDIYFDEDSHQYNVTQQPSP